MFWNRKNVEALENFTEQAEIEGRSLWQMRVCALSTTVLRWPVCLF